MRLPGGRRDGRPKVAVIGLDCAEPSLLFDRWADELPRLARLRRRGLYGSLESVVPAITAPAWACMTSGKDPGTLGLYGFRNRTDGSYDGLAIADGRAVEEPRLWDVLSRVGGHDALVLGVPQTYPPAPVDGCLVSSFLAPDTDHEYTHPPDLRERISGWVGDYMLDVDGFRTDDRDWLLDRIHTMTGQRFEVARRLLDSEPWDFFMMVVMGTDRIHHGLWKDMDPEHRDHDPDSPYRDAMLDYYRSLDAEIGTLLDRFDDETHVLVVSDHGARRMEGGIAVNEWLTREGYLTPESPPAAGEAPQRLEDVGVDWSRTQAWGTGGYYARIFLNVEGREPQGTVPADDYERVRTELKRGLETIPDEKGEPLGTRCFRPEELYDRVRGFPPDLLVYFGDLAWRSLGTVGWDAIHVFENDTGPDHANHAQDGVFVYSHPRRDLGGERLEGLHLLQVAPTVLELLGEKVPFDMQRPPIRPVLDRASARSR